MYDLTTVTLDAVNRRLANLEDRIGELEAISPPRAVSGISIANHDEILRSLGLEESESKIIEYMINRLKKGRKKYGVWDPKKDINFRREALEEVIDALNYCAMALIKAEMKGPLKEEF